MVIELNAIDANSNSRGLKKELNIISQRKRLPYLNG